MGQKIGNMMRITGKDKYVKEHKEAWTGFLSSAIDHLVAEHGLLENSEYEYVHLRSQTKSKSLIAVYAKTQIAMQIKELYSSSVNTGKSEASFIRFEIMGTSFSFASLCVSKDLDKETFLGKLTSGGNDKGKEAAGGESAASPQTATPDLESILTAGDSGVSSIDENKKLCKRTKLVQILCQ